MPSTLSGFPSAGFFPASTHRVKRKKPTPKCLAQAGTAREVYLPLPYRGLSAPVGSALQSLAVVLGGLFIFWGGKQQFLSHSAALEPAPQHRGLPWICRAPVIVAAPGRSETAKRSRMGQNHQKKGCCFFSKLGATP